MTITQRTTKHENCTVCIRDREVPFKKELFWISNTRFELVCVDYRCKHRSKHIQWVSDLDRKNMILAGVKYDPSRTLKSDHKLRRKQWQYLQKIVSPHG